VPTPDAPADALRVRFLADCRAAGPVGPEERIGLAVSGGADSLALLLLANAAFPGRIEAATVDHGLRLAAAGEAAHVAALCATIGVPHATLKRAGPLPRGNVSAQARALRYGLLQQWFDLRGLVWLMTGHHADDQLETMVMRLNRGAGVGGLASVRVRNGRTLRPLLGWRHAELVALVDAAGWHAVDDPSNRDDRYDRARLRKALAGADFLDPIGVNRAAAAMEEADEALAWSAQHWAHSRVAEEGAALVFDPHGLPVELVRRVLLGCIVRVNPKARCTGPGLSRLLETLRRGGRATLDGVLADARGAHWRLALAPPRRVR
jgi:tRNA(Ile)-lysidine synthase